MQFSRATLLNNLTVGDIFCAEAPNGARPFCLVTSVSDEQIHARTMSTQILLSFGRHSGIAEYFGHGSGTDIDSVPYSIVSVAPLPVDIHNILLGLDRKHRLEQDPERIKLSNAECRALLFIAWHYRENPLQQA